MTTVIYMGSFDEVYVPAIGQFVRRHEAIEVSEDIAGTEPKGSPGQEGYDPGSGLLAQFDVWVKPAAGVVVNPPPADQNTPPEGEDN